MQNKNYIDDLFFVPKELSDEEKEGQEAVVKKLTEIRKAHVDIVAIQKNEKPLLRTGFPYVDDFLPDGLANKMVFAGSRPAMGKTYNCSELIDNLLSPEVNPEQEINILRFNWEMISSSLLLRELRKVLNKRMKEIISTPYTLEEQPLVRAVIAKLDDTRITNVSRILEGTELRYLLRKFCEINPEQKKIVIVDHLHILGSKDRIDDFLSICNDFKLEFPNFTLIGYFQLNRTLETMWRGNADSKANPKNFRPHSGFIYNTDALQQYGDLIYTLIIPQVANLDEYASVAKEYYMHLEEHFVEGSDDSVWARLKGRNRLYIDIIKVRLVDDFEDPRLFCYLLDPSKESYEPRENKKEYKAKSSMPVFGEKKDTSKSPEEVAEEIKALPYVFPADAFGPPVAFDEDDNDDRPF
jgi:hypothetical protein